MRMVRRSDDAAYAISTGKMNSASVASMVDPASPPKRGRPGDGWECWGVMVNKAQKRRGHAAPFDFQNLLDPKVRRGQVPVALFSLVDTRSNRADKLPPRVVAAAM